MSFGLKDAGVMYQQLVNRIFAQQIGKTMEVYVDHVLHLKEMFTTLRRYKMNFNPNKSYFGVESKKFVGYIVTRHGNEANP